MRARSRSRVRRCRGWRHDGAGIAYVFAMAGHCVTVVEPSPARRAALLAELAAVAGEGVRRGRLDEAAAGELMGRLCVVDDIGELPEGLALVVETVPEQVELKRRVLTAIEQRSPVLIGTNTSSIAIGSLATALARPEAFLGMHFFNPVWSLALVELVRGAATSPAALEQARSFVAGIGKEAIVVADVAGFATSRLDFAAALEAMRMLEDGVASADDIDRAATLAYRHPVARCA